MIHPTQKHRLIPVVVVLTALILVGGGAHAASVTLAYGGDGVYPRDASANSERYFRATVSWAPASEAVPNIWLSGASGDATINPGLYIRQNGQWLDETNGVAVYQTSGGTTVTYIVTIGPLAGYDEWNSPHAQGNVCGHVYGGGQGTYQFPFRINATVVTSSGSSTAYDEGHYRTCGDNIDILEWFSGNANGVDPLSVNGTGADAGSSSSIYHFRVQYKFPDCPLLLLPRWGTEAQPSGPEATFVDADNGWANVSVSWDRDWDSWIYFPSIGRAWGDVSTTRPRFDDHCDTTGYYFNYYPPEVVLIIDGDRSRPHYMERENPSDSNPGDVGGMRYYYDLLPTDYADFMDNVLLFPYDNPGPDPLDLFPSGVNARSVSNNYVAISSGSHTYEFLATDDFSPPDGNRAWLQVGRPGNSGRNEYMKPIIGGSGAMQSDFVMTRFADGDGASGGLGYPYDSQSGNYPLVNPMLTAHPYFPRGCITPGQSGSALDVTPGGTATDPFTAETGAGPNPVERVTNDDTILPNLVNIRAATDATAPFRGGKWTAASSYVLRINYWQSANVAPEYIRVQIRKKGGSFQGYTMEKATPGDSTYTDGCVYQYLATPNQLPGGGGAGDYEYYFVASDGTGTTTFPNRPAVDEMNGNIADQADIDVPIMTDGSNDYYAFRVNQPAELSSQSVTTSGSAGANFQFKVTYTDADGEMLNAGARGDRPFETSLYVDLFGSPQGQARVVAVQNNTTLTYTTETGTLYDDGDLAGYTLEVGNGTAMGKVYTIATNTGNAITLAAGSTVLTDGVVASNQIRFANWFHGTMVPEDSSDTTYTDGAVYTWDSASHAVLGEGTHRYYFVFLDDWGSWLYPDDSNVKIEGETVRYPLTGSFEGPEVLANNPPWLTDYRFTPHAVSGADGTTATPFTFSVTYKDNEDSANLLPASIRVGIDGTAAAPDIVLEMTQEKPADTNYSDGAVFKSAPVKLSEGRHIFRAQAIDGSGGRFPDVPANATFIFSGPHETADDLSTPLIDSVDGPLVSANTRPTLTFPSTDNGSDAANPPGLEPNSGQAATVFTYTVVYTDSDRFAGVAGNPPDYVQVYVDGVVHDMTPVDGTDTDYTDGATFTYTTTGFTEGTHNYFFVASDGLDRARKPAAGATPNRYYGPVVDEPPGVAQSLLAQDTPNDNGGSVDLTFSPSTDDGGGARDVTAYRIYRGTSAGSYGATPVVTVTASGLAAYSTKDTSAVTGTSYYYVVRSWDGANESADSNVAGPVSAIDNINPQPPSNVTVADPGLGGTINVSWNASADDGGGQGDVTEYHVYRSTTTAFSGSPVGTVAAGLTSFTDTSVADNTDYYYMVRAYDGANESVDSNTAGPVQSTDQQAPVIDDLYPANRALDVPIDTYIGFTVADSGTGVDRTTLSTTVTADGAAVTLGSPTITGTAAQYTVKYQPTEVFDYRAVVVVSVSVSDVGGKVATRTWKFTAAGPDTYTISGTILSTGSVPKAGVVVSAGDLSATTDVAGNYTITGLAAGTYTVTPTLRGFCFSPTSQTVQVDGNTTGVDFTWAPGYDIAGLVKDEDGNPMQGVSVTNGLATSITSDTGYFRMLDMPAGTYSVIASLPRYVFEPESLSVQVDASHSGLGQRFVGRLQTFGVSGTITDSDGSRLKAVTVAATSGTSTVEAITNASGQYSLSGLLPGTWTITPRKADYEFNPASQSLDIDDDVTELNFVGVPIYNLTLGSGLSFVGVPVEPEDSSPMTVFGDPSVIPAYRYNPATGRYVGSNGSWTGIQVQPGRGFFVSASAQTTLAVAGSPVAKNRAVSIALDATNDGWNMVGNPYDAVLPWSNVGVTSGSAVRDFGYVYNRSTGSYELITDVPGIGDGTSIPKNAGFWMRALSSQSVTIAAVSTTAEARYEAYTRSAGEFVIPIAASVGKVADTCARVGVLGYAKTNPSAYAIDNPPTTERYVDVYFTGGDGKLLTCDIRGAAAEKLSYDFAVRTNLKNRVVKLSLPDLSQVPRDKSIVLVDVAAGKRVYARTMADYTYNSGEGGARQFRLEIAAATAGGLAVTITPAQTKSGAIALSYTLAQPATVSISVMNLSGRTVRVLASGAQGTAGVNSASWDLRNQTGSRVPAGRYLVQIRASGDNGQQVTAVAPLNVN